VLTLPRFDRVLIIGCFANPSIPFLATDYWRHVNNLNRFKSGPLLSSALSIPIREVNKCFIPSSVWRKNIMRNELLVAVHVSDHHSVLDSFIQRMLGSSVPGGQFLSLVAARRPPVQLRVPVPRQQPSAREVGKIFLQLQHSGGWSIRTGTANLSTVPSLAMDLVLYEARGQFPSKSGQASDLTWRKCPYSDALGTTHLIGSSSSQGIPTRSGRWFPRCTTSPTRVLLWR